MNIDDLLEEIHNDISFTFSRSMDPATITKNNIKVTSLHSNDSEVLYESKDNSLIVRNDALYRLNEISRRDIYVCRQKLIDILYHAKWLFLRLGR